MTKKLLLNLNLFRPGGQRGCHTATSAYHFPGQLLKRQEMKLKII